MAVCQNPGTPVVHIKIAGFMDVHPTKNGIIVIGIDPYPYDLLGHFSRSAARSAAAVQQRRLSVRHGASVWLFFSGLMLKL
jgi:hypothetical protein